MPAKSGFSFFGVFVSSFLVCFFLLFDNRKRQKQTGVMAKSL